MNLLYIDKTNFQRTARTTLIEERMKAEVNVIDSLGDLYQLYETGEYDMVMIDPTISDGQTYVDYILSKDPKQQILVVSDAASCVVKRCEDCTLNHNIRRLFNPTPIPNILRMLEGFVHYECDHYDAQTNLLTS